MLPPPAPPRPRRAPGTLEPTGLAPALVLLGFGVTALCAVAALLIWGSRTAPLPTAVLPVVAPSYAPPATSAPASIRGAIWDDACDEHRPSTPACVVDNLGRYRANGNWDPSEDAVGGLLVTLGLGQCPAATSVTALTGADGRYHFGGLPPGTYCVAVDPAQPQNRGLGRGTWSWPTAGAGVMAQVTVSAAGGEEAATVNFGWDHQEPPRTPPPTLAPGPPLDPPTVTPGCSNHAAFMADVTIPAGAVLPASAPFTKTWRVLNTGSCTWGLGYALLFAAGEAMSGTLTVPLSATVAPGSTLDLSVGLVAPDTLGPHTGDWRLRDNEGQPFGTGPNADIPLKVSIQVSLALTPTPAPLVWQASFFANRDLAGAPVLTRSDAAPSFDWGLESPGPGVPADDFSARWTGAPVLEDGVYRFSLTMDDGARLFVDGELVIDEWHDANRHEVNVERALLAGAHPVRLEYYDRINEAVALLRWERVAAYPYWRGEYWANTTLGGSPLVTRNDIGLDFTWGSGGPGANLPADNFSARWTQASQFDGGAYRFHVTVDDGARLWVDDQLVVDTWPGGGVREVTGDIGLTTGPHTVRVEFVEYGGEARLAVRWEKIAGLAYPDWKAEYWSNPNLQGAPVLARNDPQPDFNWGLGAPGAGVPADNFSARWTRTLNLTPGTYRFQAVADDGVRVTVGPLRIIDEWHPSDGATEYRGEVGLTAPVVVVIEFFDNTLTARIKVTWERLGP